MPPSSPGNSQTALLAREERVEVPAESSLVRPPGVLPLFTLGAAVLLMVGFSLAFRAPAFTARFGVLLLMAAVGLPVLASLFRTEHWREAAALSAFLVVATASTLLSAQPLTALTGLYNRGTGLVFVAALAGAWALGAVLTSDWRRHLRTALLVGVFINAAVALLQLTVLPQIAGLRMLGGRTVGLLGNPVFLGAALGGGLALLVMTEWHRPLPIAAGAFLLAAALQTTGGRTDFIATCGLAAMAVLRTRDRKGVISAAAIGAGLVTGLMLVSAFAGTAFSERGGMTNSGTRLEGLATTPQMLADNFVVGAGPGLFRIQAAAHRNIELVQARSPENLWEDAHNIVAEYAVTTGLAGFGALAAFLVLAVRRARGPFLWCALTLLGFHMLQPLNAAVTPVMFLALGAAGRAPARLVPSRRRTAATVVLVTPALIVALVLAAGDVALNRAHRDFSLADAELAAAYLPWADAPDAAAHVNKFYLVSERDPAYGQAAISWYLDAAHRDPSDPLRWNRLAEAELIVGELAAARSHYMVALSLNEWSERAMLGLGEIALLEGRIDDARHWAQQTLEIRDSDVASSLLRRASGMAGDR